MEFDQYVIEKYGKEIVELAFEDLSTEDKKLAISSGWAWAAVNHADLAQSTQLRGYLFRPGQADFWYAPVFYPAMFGAIGGGKTHIGVLKGLDLSITYPGTRGVIIRNTEVDLKRTCLATLRKIFAHLGWKENEQYTHHVSDKLYRINTKDKSGRKVESEILYMPARENDSTSIDDMVQRFGSLEVDWFMIEEARELEDRVVRTIIPRRGRWGKIVPENNIYGKAYYKPWHRVGMFVGYPPAIGHHLHKRFYLKQLNNGQPLRENIAKHFFVVQTSTYDNRRNLPADTIASMESESEDWKRTYLYGEPGYIPPEGEAVYSHFKFDTHVSKKHLQYHKELPMVRGWDAGIGDKHKACVIMQMDPRGILLVLREILYLESGVKAFREHVKKVCRIYYPEAEDWKDFGDPAMKVKSQTDDRSVADIMYEGGIVLIDGAKEMTVRVDAVTELLKTMIDGQPAIQFDPQNCPHLIEGFQGGYYYKIINEGQGIYSRKPVKTLQSHCINALEYPISKIAYVKSKQHKRDLLAQIKKRVRAI